MDVWFESNPITKKRIHSIRKLPSSSALRYSGQAQDS